MFGDDGEGDTQAERGILMSQTVIFSSETTIERIVDLYAEACDAAPATMHLDPRRFFDPVIFERIASEHDASAYVWTEAEARARSLYSTKLKRTEFQCGVGGGKRIIRSSAPFS